jgi:hypothetical protein
MDSIGLNSGQYKMFVHHDGNIFCLLPVEGGQGMFEPSICAAGRPSSHAQVVYHRHGRIERGVVAGSVMQPFTPRRPRPGFARHM